MATRELENKLIEAQISIADSLQGINTNIKILNDHNILHASENKAEHETIIDKLKVMTEKYWWLIIVLIAALVMALGAPKIAAMFL